MSPIFGKPKTLTQAKPASPETSTDHAAKDAMAAPASREVVTDVSQTLEEKVAKLERKLDMYEEALSKTELKLRLAFADLEKKRREIEAIPTPEHARARITELENRQRELGTAVAQLQKRHDVELPQQLAAVEDDIQRRREDLASLPVPATVRDEFAQAKAKLAHINSEIEQAERALEGIPKPEDALARVTTLESREAELKAAAAQLDSGIEERRRALAGMADPSTARAELVKLQEQRAGVEKTLQELDRDWHIASPRLVELRQQLDRSVEALNTAQGLTAYYDGAPFPTDRVRILLDKQAGVPGVVRLSDRDSWLKAAFPGIYGVNGQLAMPLKDVLKNPWALRILSTEEHLEQRIERALDLAPEAWQIYQECEWAFQEASQWEATNHQHFMAPFARHASKEAYCGLAKAKLKTLAEKPLDQPGASRPWEDALVFLLKGAFTEARRLVEDRSGYRMNVKYLGRQSLDDGDVQHVVASAMQKVLYEEERATKGEDWTIPPLVAKDLAFMRQNCPDQWKFYSLLPYLDDAWAQVRKGGELAWAWAYVAAPFVEYLRAFFSDKVPLPPTDK